MSETRPTFDPNCEDCCDPVTPCQVHRATPSSSPAPGAPPTTTDCAARPDPCGECDECRISAEEAALSTKPPRFCGEPGCCLDMCLWPTRAEWEAREIAASPPVGGAPHVHRYDPILPRADGVRWVECACGERWLESEWLAATAGVCTPVEADAPAEATRWDCMDCGSVFGGHPSASLHADQYGHVVRKAPENRTAPAASVGTGTAFTTASSDENEIFAYAGKSRRTDAPEEAREWATQEGRAAMLERILARRAQGPVWEISGDRTTHDLLQTLGALETALTAEHTARLAAEQRVHELEEQLKNAGG